MNKESLLFGIAGLLLGLIIGFIFANTVNKNAATTASSAVVAQQNADLPPGHPSVDRAAEDPASIPEVQAAIDKAKQEPNSFDAQIEVARLYYEIESYENSIEYLARANKLKPDDYMTIVNLGNANFDSNRFEEAEKWYLAALAKEPQAVGVRTDMGLTFMFRAKPDLDRAIQEFQRSLAIDPNHPQTLQNLTVAYIKKGDVENAKSTLSRYEALNSSSPAVAKLREEIQKLEVK